MPQVKELTEDEINEIGKQSGVDPDIIRSWHKGMRLVTLIYGYFFKCLGYFAL